MVFKGSDQPVETVVGFTSEADLAKILNKFLG
jgi:hypothetical protein